MRPWQPGPLVSFFGSSGQYGLTGTVELRRMPCAHAPERTRVRAQEYRGCFCTLCR